MAQATTTTADAERRAPPCKMTYEEFLAWCDEDTRAEWVNGEVIIMSPASNRHQDLADFLTAVLRYFTEVLRLGVVRSAPFQMKLGPTGSGREPDVLFLKREHLDRLLPTRLDGPADLAVEIASRDSVGRDRGDKFVEYEAAGVPEYWLLDPERKQAEFYQLAPDGRYHPVPLDEHGIYHSAILPGFWLRVDWLWQESLPELRTVLDELGVR